MTWPNPRFTDNLDGTVTDNQTRLIWLKSANCFGYNEFWDDALTLCNSLASGGCGGLSDGSVAGDWRMPNIKELLSLIDWSQYNHALPSGHPFSGVQVNYYWTSTTRAANTGQAWLVYMHDGNVVSFSKSTTNYVWPVRDGNL
jgi:hypothetical protein